MDISNLIKALSFEEDNRDWTGRAVIFYDCPVCNETFETNYGSEVLICERCGGVVLENYFSSISMSNLSMVIEALQNIALANEISKYKEDCLIRESMGLKQPILPDCLKGVL